MRRNAFIRKSLVFGVVLGICIGPQGNAQTAQKSPTVNKSTLFAGLNYLEYVTPITRPALNFQVDERLGSYSLGFSVGGLFTGDRKFRSTQWKFLTLGRFSLLEGVATYGFANQSRQYALGGRYRYVTGPINEEDNVVINRGSSFNSYRMAYGLETLYKTVIGKDLEAFSYLVYSFSVSFGNFHWFEYIRISIGYRQFLEPQSPNASQIPFEIRISVFPMNMAMPF